MKKSAAPIWILSFAIFPLALGGVILSFFDLLQGIQSENWTEVPAIILSSQRVPFSLGPDQPHIRYQFALNEKPQVSTRIWPGSFPNGTPVLRQSTAEKLVQTFPEGKRVMIRVRDGKSLKSVLIPGPWPAARWLLAFLIFLALSALSGWGAARKK